MDKNFFFKNKKVFITGINGFKGSWLSFYLNSVGSKVSGIGLKKDSSEFFQKLKIYNKVEFYNQNILDFYNVNKLVKKFKPDLIIHLAAQSIVAHSYINPIETFNINVIGSGNILQITKEQNIPGLVYITSDKCYLNKETLKPYKENDTLGGIDFYSSSKASAELLFYSYYKNFFSKNKFLKIGSARAGNVIGGGDIKSYRIIPDLYRAIKNNEKCFFLRSPSSVRPWQHVLEPITGYMVLGKKILNNELVTNLDPSWNFGPDIINVCNVKKLCDLFGENFKHKIILKKHISKNKFYESKLLYLSNKKAKKELNWKPRLNLKNTISFTSEWYKKNLHSDLKSLNNETIKQIDFFNHFYNF
jgi:CDP-glucose 4,6-dehydratase